MIYTFWNNLYKFPRFLIAVLVGFFLTTFQPIFKLLKNKKYKLIFIVITITIIRIIYLILKIMTE
uniref:Uncharacterized protein ycf33 n=1 Tax=Membranoptera platyphylla TaxID=1204437 RepID=A0A1I9KQJ2_9FLOR|nr:conserved hypothetical plastid protein Ycf33 [Membranoptera platyphylla]AMJ16894.1 conserved hypothetical plastid protein Ycf33 [Membranoptera platyphylla]